METDEDLGGVEGGIMAVGGGRGGGAVAAAEEVWRGELGCELVGMVGECLRVIDLGLILRGVRCSQSEIEECFI